MRALSVLFTSSLLLPACGGDPDPVADGALRPSSGERIDCGGATIGGASVLMYLIDVENVTIENCVFESADFGIIVARGGGHQIRGNVFGEIYDTAIWVVGSSDNEVSDNVMDIPGGGVMFNGNSDGNRVHDNTIAAGLGIGAYWTPSQAVINVVVDGELTQLVNEVDMLDDLRIWDNEIELHEEGFVGIGLMGRTQDGHVSTNTVTGSGSGLGMGSWGYEPETPVVLPGTCSDDPTRRCAPDEFLDEGSDCFIAGLDETSKGTCEDAQLLEGETRVIRSTFADNVISGTETGVEAYLAPSTIVERNDVSSCDIGVRIGDFMLESGTVVGNVFSGNEVGIAIDNLYATTAGATIAYNDFVDNLTPDHTQQWTCSECETTDYELTTDLSLNHWGVTCADGGAPTFNDADLVATPAYEAPVAEAYRAAVEAGGEIDPAALGVRCP